MEQQNWINQPVVFCNCTGDEGVLRELLQQAADLAEKIPLDQQLVLVKTARGNLYHFINDWHANEGRDESRFASMLMGKRDTQLDCLICLWHEKDLVLDAPSGHLRTLLLGACPENRSALLFLQGENHFNVRTLESILPG